MAARGGVSVMAEGHAAAARELAAKLERRAARLALKENGLRHVGTEQLTIRRQRKGTGFTFLTPTGRTLRDAGTIRRLKSLAVPPAYEDVRYAEDSRAHIQAIGRDAAGRWQYRYHPDWEKVREGAKGKRLISLIKVLPRIRRGVGQRLSTLEPTREFALAAVVELISRSAIRPGSESYVRMHGTRGAATLLKTNVTVDHDRICLKFRGKGSRDVYKEFRSARLAAAIETLRALPGKRLFQYLSESGDVRHVNRREVNTFLHQLAGVKIALKDFRTLSASAAALEMLAHMPPATSARRRRMQVLEAVRSVSEHLANTPTVCRKSYVHDTIFVAFENGTLHRYSAALKLCRTTARREQVLAQVVAASVA
jgi:DNA topoisomerase-1